MKKILILVAAAIFVAACEKAPESVDVMLDFSATDKGFELPDGTYASATAFAEGDCIGLFGVMDGAIVEGINNLCLTAAGNGTWQSTDASMTFPTGAVYYAYYPYQADFTASVNTSASNAAEFFSELISQWPVAENQSGDGFKASNLLVASARTSSESLNIELAPAMGLVKVGVNGKIYTFTNTDYELSDYFASADKMSFSGNIPAIGDGGYLFVVRPGAYSIEYTYQGETQTAEGTVESGKCSVAREGDAEYIEHNLQIGDFYLADGSLLSKDTPAFDVASSDVIGVVVVIDPTRIGEGEREALGGNAHALVLASMLAGNGGMFRWYTDYSNPDYDTYYIRDEAEIGLSTVPEISDFNVLFNSAHADIEGYTNYNLIMTKRAEDVASGYYPCFTAVQNFTEEVGGPVEGVSTGWFLPASGQLLDAICSICGGLDLNASNITEAQVEGYMSWGGNGNLADKANEIFEKIPWGKKIVFKDNSNGMATSTQSSAEGYRFIDFGNHGFVDYNWSHKFTTTFVRPMLAF